MRLVSQSIYARYRGGVVGQIVAINDQPNHVVVLAPSFGEFLQSILDGYKNGRFQYSEGAWSER